MVSRFEEFGFLADELSDWSASKSPRAARHIALASDISGFIQSRIYSTPIPRVDCHQRRNDRGLVVAMLFMRGISMYQGTMLLANRGMVGEAAILCRGLIELAFKCRAIQLDWTALAIYVAEEAHFRMKLASELLKSTDVVLDEDERRHLLERRFQLQHQIEQDGHKKPLHIADWAKMAELESTYRTAYALLSGQVHSGAHTLERMVVLDEDQVLDSLAFEPQLNETILLCASDFALVLCDAFDYEFGLYWSDHLGRFKCRLEELMQDRDHDASHRRPDRR